MRRYLVLAGLLLSGAALAGSGTLRVGSEVLVVGDSATRVLELLGKPTYRAHGKAASSSRKGGRKGSRSPSSGGQQWQYRQGRRVVTVVIADGKVAAIRDDGR
jgi:hypothetical protein